MGVGDLVNSPGGPSPHQAGVAQGKSLSTDHPAATSATTEPSNPSEGQSEQMASGQGLERQEAGGVLSATHGSGPGTSEVSPTQDEDQDRSTRPGEAPGQSKQGRSENEQQLDPPQQALSDEESLSRAEGLKREGNELFGQGLWDEAAAKYNEALDTAPESAKREQAIYFANLAACNIKTQQYAVAVENCTAAIRLDPSYQKAYMRRCEAFERLDELDHALSDAKKLLELAPDSAWAKGKVAALQPVVEERAEKLKTEMFSKLKDLGNTILGKFGLSVDNFKFDKDPNTGGYSVRFER